LYNDQSEGIFGNRDLWRGNCQPGQLTGVGGEMCTRIGAGLRSIYIDKFHLIPSSLTKDDLKLIELRSTDVQRTHESLASVFEGLYPADTRNGVYLPVHMSPLSCDIMQMAASACPRIAQLIVANTAMSSEWMARYNELKPVIDTINQIAGTVNVSNFDDHYTTGVWPDIFRSRECHNMPYPCTADGQTCVTQDMVDKITGFADDIYSLFFAGDEIKRLTGGQILVDILNSFNKRISSDSTPRYIHYSAHDVSIGMALAALNYDPRQPPYASTLRFELWQTESGASPKYAVQIVYDNKVVRPDGCSADMCPLEEFANIINTRLVIKDKAKECALQ